MGLYFDGKFKGELFTVETYSEEDQNWGILIIMIDDKPSPCIFTVRRDAQQSQRKFDEVFKIENMKVKTRVARFIRG